MKTVFLIPGYGLPKNIKPDENYNIYLKSVFNTIWDLTVKNKIVKPLIILSGGKTDCFKPYQRTEAEEMAKIFKPLIQRTRIKSQTRGWQVALEKKSLSTLENLLFCRDILRKKKINSGQLYVFCEMTRQERMKILARKVLGKKFKIKVWAVDFDHSQNRYLDPKFISKKEKAGTKFALGALKSPAKFQEHHRVFVKKFKFLRQHDPAKHPQAVKKWMTEQMKILEGK